MANSIFGGDIVMEVSIEKLEEAQRVLEEQLKKIERGKRGAMTAAVGQLHRFATGHVAFKTGRLKNSIFAEVQNGGERGIVATNVHYAPYIEYGTRFMSAKSFMRKAVDVEGPAAIRTYKSILLQG